MKDIQRMKTEQYMLMMMGVVSNQNRRLEIIIFQNITSNMVIEVILYPDITSNIRENKGHILEEK